MVLPRNSCLREFRRLVPSCDSGGTVVLTELKSHIELNCVVTGRSVLTFAGGKTVIPLRGCVAYTSV